MGAKELIKAGAVRLSGAEIDSITRELHMQIHQTVLGGLYNAEKPEKHKLNKFPQYDGTPHAFNERMEKSKDLRKAFSEDCNKMLEQLKLAKEQSTGNQQTEIANCIKWLEKVK